MFVGVCLWVWVVVVVVGVVGVGVVVMWGVNDCLGGDKLNYLCSLLARIAAINVYKSPEHGPNLSGS